MAAEKGMTQISLLIRRSGSPGMMRSNSTGGFGRSGDRGTSPVCDGDRTGDREASPAWDGDDDRDGEE
jgi:hypothetical protein